jgi:hypothetical protein
MNARNRGATMVPPVGLINPSNNAADHTGSLAASPFLSCSRCRFLLLSMGGEGPPESTTAPHAEPGDRSQVQQNGCGFGSRGRCG